MKMQTAEQAVLSVNKSKENGKTQIVLASVAVIPSTQNLKVKGEAE
jgi:hypothetical protein